jgi:hypothetical protein
VCFIGLVVCCPTGLRAENVYVTDDTYIDNRSPDADFGGANGLKVFVNKTNAQPTRVLIAVPAEIGTIPADNLVSVKLRVYNYGFTPLNRDIELHPLTRHFVEGSATWNKYDGTNAWTTAGGDYATDMVSIDPPPPRGGVEEWFSFDITSMLKGLSRADLLDHGLLLKVFDDFNPPSATTGQNFVSSDNATYWDCHPRFEVTAVPEPGACVMVLTGSVLTAGAVVLRRRQSYATAG